MWEKNGGATLKTLCALRNKVNDLRDYVTKKVLDQTGVIVSEKEQPGSRPFLHRGSFSGNSVAIQLTFSNRIN